MNDSNKNLPKIEDSINEGTLATQRKDPYYVVLPCEVKDFQKFVSGLLGKPQELRGEVAGRFKIGVQDVTNVYHLLEQRMAKQNDASIIHFGITVYYDDGHSVVHNNILDFQNYHPLSPCCPTAVSISATYLIKFRGHQTPEKQDIELTIAAQGDFKGPGPRWYRGSFLEYRIVHTERTWATDIAGLLKNYATTIIQPPSTIAKIFQNRADDLAIYFSQLTFLICVYIWTKTGLELLNTTSLDISSIRIFLGFLLKSVAAFSLLTVMLLAVKSYVESTGFFVRSSAIIFTSEDHENYVKLEKMRKMGLLRYALVWLGTLATGVLTNIIHSKNWFW